MNRLLEYPNYKRWQPKLKGGLISFYVLNLSLGNAVLSRGLKSIAKVCNQVLISTSLPFSSRAITASKISYPSEQFRGCGSAAPCRPLDSRDGYLYSVPVSPNGHLTFPRPPARPEQKEHSLSLSIVAPLAPKPSIDFHHQSLREKAANFD
jgi:hypothetical protein